MSNWETEGDVLDFLRREAPNELERLESIARLVALEGAPVPGRPMPRDSSYATWMRATYKIFHPRISSEAARTRVVPVAGERSQSWHRSEAGVPA